MTEQQTPTPIDPADIRPGDEVDVTRRIVVGDVSGDYIRATDGRIFTIPAEHTFALVHRPDPDAEAVQAIRSASYNIHHAGERMDPLPGLPEATDLLRKLREQGWDVVRRAES